MHDFTYQVAEDLPIFTALMLWTKYHPLILMPDLSLFPDTVFLAFFPRLVVAAFPLSVSPSFQLLSFLFFGRVFSRRLVRRSSSGSGPRSLVGQCTTPTLLLHLWAWIC